MSVSTQGILGMILASVPSVISYWTKWLIASVAMRYFKPSYQKRFGTYQPNAKGDAEKLGFLVPQTEKDLESPQSEEHMQKSTDEVFFYGVNSKGECALIRIARHINQQADAWIYLRTADGSSYYLKEPVNHQHSEDGESLSFSCGSLRMQVVSPMRRWRIEYSGSLIKKSADESESKKETERETESELESESGNSQETAFVKFVFLWCASSDIYDVYDPTIEKNANEFTHLLAVKEWKSIYPPPLKEFVGAWNSYVQVGNLRGTVSVDNKPDYEMHLFGDKTRNLES